MQLIIFGGAMARSLVEERFHVTVDMLSNHHADLSKSRMKKKKNKNSLGYCTHVA